MSKHSVELECFIIEHHFLSIDILNEIIFTEQASFFKFHNLLFRLYATRHVVFVHPFQLMIFVRLQQRPKSAKHSDVAFDFQLQIVQVFVTLLQVLCFLSQGIEQLGVRIQTLNQLMLLGCLSGNLILKYFLLRSQLLLSLLLTCFMRQLLL